MLENVDTDYENKLRSIYNVISKEIDLKDDPFFAAIKIPRYDAPEEATDNLPHDQNPEIEVDQVE